MSSVGRLARRAFGALTGNRLAQKEWQADGAGADGLSRHLAGLCRRAAADGCVVLENDGTLPLDANEEVAVFGRCQLDWFSMGNGSGGNVSAPYLTNLMDGLADVGARHNRVLAEVYRAWTHERANAAFAGVWGLWPQSLPEMEVTRSIAEAAASTARVAIFVIGRNAGEDQDLALREGGYYLSARELENLERVMAAFERTVVVINAANLIDLSWMHDVQGTVSALVLASEGGMEAGHAIADVLYGRVCPSGRLTATIACSYEDYPSARTFGRTRHVDYDEGIYVGYRHFDTHAADRVLYPFGHGLSYTSFLILPYALERDGAKIAARAFVENTGTVRGAVSVLLMCELAEGVIEKPRRVLAGFAKTAELEPAETCEVEVTFDLTAIASFDPDQRAYVIETGTYRLTLNGEPAGSVDVASTIVVERCEHFCETPEELRVRILERLPQEIVGTPDTSVSLTDVLEGTVTLPSFVSSLTREELELLSRGEGMMDSRYGPAGNAGAFGGTCRVLRERQIPAAICADGPSGARLAHTQTLLPSATALASTYDTALVERLYRLLGDEVRAAGVDVLLAPGMNIQRNPRCGRNFEYFSEDPLLTGRMGAAVVAGLSAAGVEACPKHLAANNQERARSIQDSRVGERALREIYLKGFEICVREARPSLIMVSYNRLNGVWCHYHFDLATTVLRREWGFTGVVLTDWWMRRARSPEFVGVRDNAYRVRAGVDVLMPGNLSRGPSLVRRDRSFEGVTTAELQRCALRVLAFLLPKAYRLQAQARQAEAKA